MSTGIEKFKLEEKVRISFLKHRGNVLKVAEETSVPVDLVKKISKKMKTRAKRDIDYMISNGIMGHLFMGVEQRVSYLKKCLDEIENKITEVLSPCCKGPALEIPSDDGTIYYECQVCQKNCVPIVRTNIGVIETLHETLRELREEDKSLVEFAEKLGYTNKEPEQVTKITQNNMYLGTQPSSKEIPGEIQRQAENLSATDREQARKRIEAEILNSENSENPDDVQPQ